MIPSAAENAQFNKPGFAAVLMNGKFSTVGNWLHIGFIVLFLTYALFRSAISHVVYYVDWYYLSPINYFVAVFAIFLISFAPGYFILNLLGLNRILDFAGRITLSFAVSLVAIPTLVFALLLSNVNPADIIWYLWPLISLLFLASWHREAHPARLQVPTRPFLRLSLSSLALIIVTLIIGYLVLWVNFLSQASFIKHDLAIYFGTSVRFFMPGWQSGWETYPVPYWFHLYLVAVASFSGIMANSVWLTNFLILLIVPAFYWMAKGLSEGPWFATTASIIFVTFAGFEWIYILPRSLGLSGAQLYNLLWNDASLKVLFQTGPFYYTWDFKPVILGTILFVVCIGLLMHQELPAKVRFPILGLTFWVGFLYHIQEMISFIWAWGFPYFILKGRSERLYLFLTLLLALLAVFPIEYLSPAKIPYNPFLVSTTVSFLLFTFYFSILLERIGRFLSRIRSRNPLRFVSFRRLVIVLSVISYSSALLVYFNTSPNIAILTDYFNLGTYPWYFFPITMGLALLLAIIYMIMWSNMAWLKHRLIILATLSTIIFASVINVANYVFRHSNLFNPYLIGTGYYAWRALNLSFIPLALLAAVPIMILSRKLADHKTFFAAMMTAIVISGSMSTAFYALKWGSEAGWATGFMPGIGLLPGQIQTAAFINSHLNANDRVIAYSSQGYFVVVVSGARHLLNNVNSLPYEIALLEARSIDSFLSAIGDASYVYLTTSDATALNRTQSVFIKCVLPFSTVVYRNLDGVLLKLPPKSTVQSICHKG